MNIKNLNESFHRLYEDVCENCVEELTFEDIETDPSLVGEIYDGDDLDMYSDILSLFCNKSRKNYEAVCDYVDSLGYKDINFGDLDVNVLKDICNHFNLIDSVEGELTEAKISPEDKHDSDIIRGIYAKLDQPGRKNFSKEEMDVMKKYDLDFSRDRWSKKRDNTGLVTKDGAHLTYTPHAKNSDKVNYADKARKAPERRQDSDYKRDNPRWSSENHSSGNPKQTWSRWQDDQEMKFDYRDKYRDLYNKRLSLRMDKAKLDSEKAYLSRLQQQLVDTENNVNAKQQSYDQQKAEWNKMLADRRAKKNESYDDELDPRDKGGYIPSDQEIKEYKNA